ncbi:MAG TPA: site-specific integrase [Chthoniobacterales bacterium]|nr:site-specific integrase [Chthoniobacterales bacterium]
MKGSRYWWFRWSQYGRRYAQSLKTEDEGLAITRAQAILAEGLSSVETFNPAEPPRRHREIHGLIDQYLVSAQARNKKPLRPGTADTRKYILQKFVKDMAISRVGEINAQKINQWLLALREQGKSQDTCWTYGQRVRSFVTYLAPKYLPSTTLTGFTLPEPAATGRQNWLRSNAVTKVLDSAKDDPELKFVLLCGFDAGLRRSEISEARVEWFDLEAGLLHVSNSGDFVTKDRDNRTIPLTDRFSQFLQGYLAGRDSGEYVLAPEKTVKGKSKYRYDANKRVRSYFSRAKVNCSFHDMRRSFASNRVSAGVSIYKVSSWLGDGIVVVQRSYGHLAPQDRDINIGC